MKKNILVYLDEDKWRNFQRYCAIMEIYPSNIFENVIDIILKDKDMEKLEIKLKKIMKEINNEKSN